MLKSLHQAKSPILVEFIYVPVALSNGCIFTSHGSMLVQCRIIHSAKFAILSKVQISKWGMERGTDRANCVSHEHSTVVLLNLKLGLLYPESSFN